MTRAWVIRWDDPLSYADGLRLQTAIHAARLEDHIPDTLLVLQHRPVVTIGRRGRTEGLLLSPEALAARGIELHAASRGGNLTYHGPGQWVLYPILRLGGHGADSHSHLWNLEEVALRTAAAYGVEAFRREGMSGAWTPGGKLAAIGFHLKRWVTLHGMSFNVDVDLAGFASIIPCGLVGEPVASLQTLLGARCPARRDVRDQLIREFGNVFRRELEEFDAAGLLPPDLARLIGG